MTPFTIRPATPADIAQIAAWTANTFDWGDYVAEALPGWLEDPAVRVMVAEDGGEVIATITASMVAPREAWAQGARVHPERRRQGIGTAVSRALWNWARERGARVVRLAVDDTNTASQAQVTAMGFRKVADWRRGGLPLDAPSPVPAGDGGARAPAIESLEPAPLAEAEPAFLSWSTGELAHAAHGLSPIGWVWQRLTLGHLNAAARRRDLLQGRPGWAIANRDDEDHWQVHWVETTPDDAAEMVRALVGLGTEAEASEVRMWIPTVPWLEEAATRLGFEFHTVGVWALEL